MLDRYITHKELATFADDKINLKRDDVSEYRAQVNRLRDKLNSYISEHPDFDLVKMLNSGSVAKGTALRTINDMDVAVYVKAGEAPQETPKLVDWLLDRLREAYGKSLKPEQFQAQHHCVTVSFRGSGLDVDVVPVLYEGEDDDYGFLITHDTGDRVHTSIPLHLRFNRSRKEAHPRFRQMVRFVKWWARTQKNERDGFRFKSFLAELILAHLFDSGVIDSNDEFPAMIQSFFGYVVRTRLGEPIVFSDFYDASDVALNGSPIQIFDPVNSKNNVAFRYGVQEQESIVEAAEDALDAVVFARRASTKGQAVEEWQRVFGTGFRGN